MYQVDIHNAKQLLTFLDRLSVETDNYFSKGENGLEELLQYNVILHTDIEVTSRLASLIKKRLKYFRGIFEGNGHQLTVECDSDTSLFSSIYDSEIRNLFIHLNKGSRSFLIADDCHASLIDNIHYTGTLIIEGDVGCMFRTATETSFFESTVNVNAKSLKLYNSEEGKLDSPSIFGGFVGADLGNCSYKLCVVSGEFKGEVSVGGFAGTIKNSKFEKCLVDDLHVIALRNAGLIAGLGRESFEVSDCQILNSKVSTNIYGGFVCGNSLGILTVNRTQLRNLQFSNEKASQYVGGIVGTAEGIVLNDVDLEAKIAANFIIAGICPDADSITVSDSIIILDITAYGYKPMMTHVYELYKDEYLTSRETEVSVEFNSTETDVHIFELGDGGYINPFKEMIK